VAATAIKRRLPSITLPLLGIPQVYLDIYQRPAKDLAFFSATVFDGQL
jgi:hypothetical protein